MGDIEKDILEKEMCEFCEQYFDRKKIRHRPRNVKICVSCVKMLKNWREEMKISKPDKKSHAYPRRPYVVNIHEESVDPGALKEFYKLLGYNPESDIHQQFMEKHNL